MARDKAAQTNIDGSDLPKYPNKRIRDNDGSGNGTPVNEIVYGDLHEFFAKLMRLYAINYNGVPDNEANGFQLVDALVAVASKNDFLLSLSTAGGILKVPTKLSLLKEGESFVCLVTADRTVETEIQGTLDLVPASKVVTFKGGDFKSGEYVRLVVTAVGVDLIRLADGDALDAIADDFGFVKAATQIEENAGAIDTVATTPLSNFTAFALRVIGADSVNFLATQIRNGLLSKEDKIIIDNFTTAERNYGTVIGINPDAGSVGDFYAVSGDVDSAQITQRTDDGNVITMTMANAMDNLTYEVNMNIESLGNIESDNDIRPPVFKKINTTQFQVYLEESANTGQDITLHLSVRQR